MRGKRENNGDVLCAVRVQEYGVLCSCFLMEEEEGLIQLPIHAAEKRRRPFTLSPI